MFFKALRPEGGASDVGKSIVHYARENGIDIAVLVRGGQERSKCRAGSRCGPCGVLVVLNCLVPSTTDRSRQDSVAE